MDFYLIESLNNHIYCKLEVITGIRHHDKLQITNKSLISYLKYFLFERRFGYLYISSLDSASFLFTLTTLNFYLTVYKKVWAFFHLYADKHLITHVDAFSIMIKFSSIAL